MEHSEQQLADTLTEEPIVFMGCTATEMITITGVSVAVSFPVGLVTGLILAALSPSFALLAGVVVAFGGAFLLALLTLNRLQTMKEQQGNNYYKERLSLFLSGMGLGDPVITRSQRYGRGRSL